MSDLNPLQNPFVFSKANVRTATDELNQVWFCAKDVCDILGIQNASQAVDKLDEDERADLSVTYDKSRDQVMIFVSESGLYSLIFRSTKPEAIKFRKWVTREVLPAIRKQGFYGQLTAPNQIALRYQKIKLLQMLEGKASKFVKESVQTSLGIVCNQLGEVVPDLKLLEQGDS